MDFIYRHRNKIFIIASIMLMLPFIFNIGLLYDDPFSMGMIRHSYSDIIKLTSLDVHPPLYYFVLKLFLSITTFWTSNIFIKILFARLLSVIFFFISLKYIIKIMKIFNINFNKYLTMLIFIILPINFGLDQQAAHIRMYSMATALGIIAVYYLLIFVQNNNFKNLLLVLIFSTLSLYTNYYFGFAVGLYILSATIYELFHKEYSSTFKLILSELISLVLFLPWLQNLMNQINMSNSNSSRILSQYSKTTITECIIVVIITLLSISAKKNTSKKLMYFSYSNVLITLILIILNIIMYPVSISMRYASTSILLLIMISVGLEFKVNISKPLLKNSFKIIIALLMAISFAKSLHGQMHDYDIPSINFISKFNSIKQNNDTNINAKQYNLDKFSWDAQGGNSIYLLSINKKISNNNYTNVYYSVGNGNVKLFKSIFPNIEHYYSKKG